MSEPAKRPVGRPGPRGAAQWPQVTVRLAPEVHAALVERAAAEGVTVTALATRIVSESTQ